MVAYRFHKVHLEGYGSFYPQEELTSAAIEDRIAPLYERLGIPLGTLERISGVRTRRMWGRDMAPSSAGKVAVEQALEHAGLEKDQVELLISCSVCRDLFEPATACIMHGKLGLSNRSLAFDITNACIGFSNGLAIAANMIESGQVKRAVVVSAENPAIIVDGNFRLIRDRDEQLSRDDLLKILPTFTLGGGAVAYVLAHADVAQTGRRYLGGAALTASEHAALCGGNGDFGVMIDEPDRYPIMETESAKLIHAAALLGNEAWKKASEVLHWSSEEVAHIICHQVGKQVNTEFYRKMGLPFEKDFAIYKDYGNMVSAALPSAVWMAAEQLPFKEGDKILTTAFGSGLNAAFSGFVW